MKPTELEIALKQAAKDVKRPKELLERIGETVVSNVKPYVPVRTGVLQGSIAYRFSNDNGLFVGSAVEYAPFVDARVGFLQSGLDDSGASIDQELQDWGDQILGEVGGLDRLGVGG